MNLAGVFISLGPAMQGRYDAMSVADLKAELKRRGATGYGNMSKSELLAQLRQLLSRSEVDLDLSNLHITSHGPPFNPEPSVRHLSFRRKIDKRFFVDILISFISCDRL